MNPSLSTTIAAIGCVVPSSIERPKRFAQELHKFVGRATLSECQEITAHVYGHADWHSLHKACSSQSNGAAFDEDLTVEEDKAREDAQVKVLCRELFDLDPDTVDLGPPPRDAPDASAAEQTQARTHDHHRDPLKRSDLAIEQLHKTFCQWFLTEQTPTLSFQAPRAQIGPDVEGIASQDFMATFPLRLAQWWRVNIPYQPEVALAIETFPWNKDRVTSILMFGRYWGELGVHYAEVIDFMMGPGTAYLLAEQYCKAAMFNMDVLSMSDERISELSLALEIQFMSIYPRDDFIKAGPQGLRRCAREAVKVLTNPKSRRGTWKT